MSKEFYCKNNCGTLVKWPEPYEKGKPPVDAKTGEPHECPNWPKKDEKKMGRRNQALARLSRWRVFRNQGLRVRRST